MFRRYVEGSVKVITFVAKSQTRVPKKELASMLCVSVRTAEYVISPLVDSGILLSHQGRFGGYDLADYEVTIEEVVRAFGYSYKQYSPQLLSLPVLEVLR